MIQLEGVTKRYGNLTALQDISFQVHKNETVGLLGRNGAGKTTLLNLLTGYFPPDAGSVRIAGKNMAEEPAACKRRIGYLPEKPPLYDEMTVESYLRFVCELREVKKQDIRKHIGEIVSLCGLQEARTRVLGHLSKGYRQRAGIAQALCGAPEILILDEPTVGLDPEQTVEIRNLIRALSTEHTVIFSSHILSEVQQACTRVLILDEGRLVMNYDTRQPENNVLHLQLSVAGETKQILKQIRSLNGFTDVRELPSAEKGVTEIRAAVTAEDSRGAAMDRAFRALADSGLRIRMIREEREDLEEVFLKSISGAVAEKQR